jgi:hypothetical protein
MTIFVSGMPVKYRVMGLIVGRPSEVCWDFLAIYMLFPSTAATLYDNLAQLAETVINSLIFCLLELIV